MEMCPSTQHCFYFQIEKSQSFLSLERISDGHYEKHIPMFAFVGLYQFFSQIWDNKESQLQ